MKLYLQMLRRYADFKSRSTRSEYWYAFLFNVIFALAIAIISGATHLVFLYPLYWLAVFLPALAIGVRRMHDVNKSGWYLLIPIYSLILCCTRGTEGDNKYGNEPGRPEYEGFLQETVQN